MRKCFATLLVVPVLLLMGSCSRGGAAGEEGGSGGGGGGGPHVFNPLDTNPPLIEIVTPVPDQAFKSGNAIAITGKTSDAEGLYQGRIRITDDANGNLIADQSYVIHGLTQYNFSFNHNLFVTIAANYTVSVRFEDHGLNVTTKTVKIKANP